MTAHQSPERLALAVRTNRAGIHDTAMSAYGSVRLARALIQWLEDESDKGEPLRAGPLDALLGTTEAALHKLGCDLERILGTDDDDQEASE